MISHISRITLLLGMLLPGMLSAQIPTYPIDVHNLQVVETCTGIFVDSGKDTLTSYGPNENYSVTFMSPGGIDSPPFIKLGFTFFELGEGDNIYIYDGQNELAPLLISATGNELMGRQIWSNSQFLHVKFVSSATAEGRGWRANLECFQLCDAFYANVTTNTGSFDFCSSTESVEFTAVAGYYGGTPTPGANISYQWNFDGTSMQGSTVTGNYQGSGAYPFRLVVADQVNGCQIDTVITVRLATIPTFNNTLSSSDTVCANEPFVLAGDVQTISWTGFPTSVETIQYITQGQPYSSSLDFNVFPQGQQITTLEDFDKVCINVEHEDFGHLSFELQCPNGTSVLLKDYGLGGANLGEPVVYGANNIPGVGYEYCFNTTPQFGTMDETAFRFHSYTDETGDIYNNQPYLPAGSYTTAESLQNFAGCPLNGQWTLNVTDRIAGTSGHITRWSMFFNEDFYPDSLIFTPTIVEESWLDQFGNVLGSNPVNATLATEGEYTFTYRVLDDFGCTRDTTLVVRALPLPKAEIVSEISLPVCEGDSTIFSVNPNMVGDELNWVYQWSLENADLPGRVSDTILANNPGTYSVLITDTLTSCVASFDLLFSERNCDLNIPNVFTPNGDGMNDVFEIENLEFYPNSVMVIYNRTGRKVFENNDYYLNWWTGENHAEGTYYYVLTYTRLGIRKQTQGIITLLR